MMPTDLRLERNLPLSKTLFGVLDTETTGLALFDKWTVRRRKPNRDKGGAIEPTDWHRIIEVGAVLVDYSGNVVDSFQSFVNPRRSIPEDATHVHGITDDEVSNAPPAADVLASLLVFLSKADILFGYNSPFDLRFMVHEWALAGASIPQMELYDVARLASRRGYGRIGLERLCGQLHIEMSQTHRALDDALATALALTVLLPRFAGNARRLYDLREIHDNVSPVYSADRAMPLVEASHQFAADWLQNRIKPRKRTGVSRRLPGTPVCISGRLPGIPRKEVTPRLEAVGYRYVQEVRSDVEFVVFGEKPAPRKVKAAEELHLAAMAGEDFLRWLAAAERTEGANEKLPAADGNDQQPTGSKDDEGPNRSEEGADDREFLTLSQHAPGQVSASEEQQGLRLESTRPSSPPEADNIGTMSAEEVERAVEYHDYQYWVLHKPEISDENYDLLVRRLRGLKPDSPVLESLSGGRLATDSLQNKVTHQTPMLSLDKCHDNAEFLAWVDNTVAREIKSAAQHADEDSHIGIRYRQFYRSDEETKRKERQRLLSNARNRLKKETDLARRQNTERDIEELKAAVEALSKSLGRHLREASGQLIVAVSPKVDGVAASLRYGADGNLAVAATRGDGKVGEDITLNARLIPDIPWELPEGNLEIRGEVYMKMSVFDAKYKGRFPNPRNLTAGSLKQKETNRKQLLDLSFFAYDLLGAAGIQTEEQKRERLIGLGFSPVETGFVRIDSVPAEYEQAVGRRGEWDFEADGIVVKLDDLALQDLLGATGHHPRSAMAYKFQGDTGLTTLLDIEWSVARTGVITPVALVEPIFLSGAKVSRSSLHHISHIKGQLDLSLGDTVRVTRRGGVIPKIEESLGGGAESVRVPADCPSCGSQTILAAPACFVAGARVDALADSPQLQSVVSVQSELVAKVAVVERLDDRVDLCNRAARYQPTRQKAAEDYVHGPSGPKYVSHVQKTDDAYKRELTWDQLPRDAAGKRARAAKKTEIRTFLSSLPSVMSPAAQTLVVFVLDPNIRRCVDLLSMLAPLIHPYRLDVRIMLVSSSRHDSPKSTQRGAYHALAEAGRRAEFFDELASMADNLGEALRVGAVTSEGDFSEEFLAKAERKAYAMADFLFCSTPETCRDSVVGRLEHFVDTIDVDGLGRKLLEKLYDCGLVSTLADIYRLSVEQLVELEKVGKVLAEKLVDNIRSATTLPLAVFLRGLGIEQLGPHVAGIFETECGSLERILQLTEEGLAEAHPSIRFGIAHQVVHGLRRSRDEIELLLEHVQIETEGGEAGLAGPLAGAGFVFTGKMAKLGRKAAQAKVNELGGETPAGVTKDLDFLVIGDEGSPLFGEGKKGGKMRKAEKYNEEGAGIRIISETDFIKIVDGEWPESSS